MPVFKNEDNGTWYVMARYVNWKGERKQKCKRGFSTKKEAQEWERMFQLQNSSDMDMSFEAFTELYIRDMKSRLKENTWLTKEHIIRTKKEILDEQGNLRTGCSIIPKGEVYENHIFTKKDEWFKSDAFTREVKEMFTEIINSHVKEESEKLSVFQQGGVYLATKKIGKNNPKEAEIRADNVARQEWNRTVDVALVEGVPEEDILTVKREKITDKTLQSIRTHGWLPDMLQQIIRGAKDFLQEMIFKFKLPPKPVPKIDLQEWNDMRKLMEKLQKQSQAMKSTQQEISSLKKQLSETTGFFKGKVRKSLEGKIERAEKQEKRIYTDMEQTVKQAGYPNVLSFAKTYQKSEKLVREYNEELQAWENNTEQKKEQLSELPKKASIREKLHCYQQESRQQPKQTVKKKLKDRER